MNKLYLHKKTGNIYRELMRGALEANLAPVVIYQWVEGGTVWVSPAAEFDDGRFAPWDDETAPTADKPLIDRLKAAVEGECDGLAITDEQAKAILSYVLGDDDLSSLLIAAQEENSRLREALEKTNKVVDWVDANFANQDMTHKEFRVFVAQMADEIIEARASNVDGREG